MAGYWLKLYTEILDDPKYFKLSDHAKLAMFELLIIAKKYDNTGDLPSIDNICFHSRREIDWWTDALEELERIKFIVVPPDDKLDDPLKIRKFAERQAAVPGYERAKRSRELRNTPPPGKINPCNETHDIACETHDIACDNVTNVSRTCNERDGESYIESEPDIYTEVESEPDPIVIVERSKSKKPLKDDLKPKAAAALKTRMVSTKTIQELLPDHPGERILEYCKAYDEMKLQDPDKTHPGWLVKAIQESWDISGILKKAAARRPDPNSEQGRRSYVDGKYAEFIEH